MATIPASIARVPAVPCGGEYANHSRSARAGLELINQGQALRLWYDE